MGDLIAAEWLKLRKRPMTWWLLGILAFVVSAVFLGSYAFSFFRTRGGGDPASAEAARSLIVLPRGPATALSAVSFLFDSLLMIAIAVVLGNEYQFGTLRTHLATGVGRVPYLVAKIVAVLLAGLAGLVAMLLFGTILSLIATAVTRHDFAFRGAFGAALWQTVGVLLLGTLARFAIALFVTTLARSVAAGAAVSLGFNLVEGTLVGILMGVGGGYARLANGLISPNLRALSPGLNRATSSGAHLLPPAAAAAVLVACVFVGVAASLAVFIRRDVTGAA